MYPLTLIGVARPIRLPKTLSQKSRATRLALDVYENHCSENEESEESNRADCRVRHEEL